MKVGVVILSRFNSSRLPGKALMKIEGKETLSYIIERLLQVLSKNLIIIATSSQESDDPIAKFAVENNLNCFRGSLENVSERFYFAAKSQDWDYAVRINGDNVFLDINVLKHMLAIANSGKYNFISNVKGRTFPKGMSVEIVNLEYYATLMPEIALSDSYREHVTLYLYELNEQNHFFYINEESPETAGLQMALDTAEDFERTKMIIKSFKSEHWNYNLNEIYNILKLINNGSSI